MKINIKKIKEIEELASRVEGKSTTRLFSASSMIQSIQKAETFFKINKIRRPDQVGYSVQCDPEAVCKGYRFAAFGTFFRLERFPTGWFLVRIWRDRGSKAASGNRERFRIIDRSGKKTTI